MEISQGGEIGKSSDEFLAFPGRIDNPSDEILPCARSSTVQVQTWTAPLDRQGDEAPGRKKDPGSRRL
jgi:hypothetical protein